MNRIATFTIAVILSLAAAGAYAQANVDVRGPLGVPAAEMASLTGGRSVKHDLIGQAVFDEHRQKIGKIDDLILGEDTKAIYTIVGVGGFVGVGRHDVALPMSQMQKQEGKLVLPGATKAALKAMPKFDYPKNK